MEQQLLLRQEPPISTCTWFHIDPSSGISLEDVQEQLQKRAHTIVVANPWLQGRLEGRKIAYEDVTDDVSDENSALHAKETVLRIQDPSIHERVDPKALSSSLATYAMLDDDDDDDPTKGPLWRIHLVTNDAVSKDKQDPISFGLVLTISHLLVDAHAYYEIFQMLVSGLLVLNEQEHSSNAGAATAKADVYSMDMRIPQDSEQLAQDFVGGPTVWKWMHSPWQLVKGALGIIESQLLRPLLIQMNNEDSSMAGGREFWFEVDEHEMAVYKQVHTLTPKDDDILDARRISTNDVLCHWFFQSTNCQLGAVCANYRGRLLRHDQNLGRNHWGLIAMTPDQFESPQRLRQQIQHPRIDDPSNFPDNPLDWLRLRPFGIASSWAFRLGQDPSQSAIGSRPTGTSTSVIQQREHWPILDFASYCPANYVVLRTWWIERPDSNGGSITTATSRLGVYVAGDAKWLHELQRDLDQQTLPGFLKSLL